MAAQMGHLLHCTYPPPRTYIGIENSRVITYMGRNTHQISAYFAMSALSRWARNIFTEKHSQPLYYEYFPIWCQTYSFKSHSSYIRVYEIKICFTAECWEQILTDQLVPLRAESPLAIKINRTTLKAPRPVLLHCDPSRQTAIPLQATVCQNTFQRLSFHASCIIATIYGFTYIVSLSHQPQTCI